MDLYLSLFREITKLRIKDNNQPVFFYRLAKDDSVEQHDFELTATDNTNHVLLALADMHLANRNNDLSQFKLRFLPDLNTTVEKYRSEGKKYTASRWAI